MDEAELLEAMLDGADKDPHSADPSLCAPRLPLVRVQRLALPLTTTPGATAPAAVTVFESAGFAAALAEFEAPTSVGFLSASNTSGAAAEAAGAVLKHPTGAGRTLQVEVSLQSEPAGAGAPAHQTAVFLAFFSP